MRCSARSRKRDSQVQKVFGTLRRAPQIDHYDGGDDQRLIRRLLTKMAGKRKMARPQGRRSPAMPTVQITPEQAQPNAAPSNVRVKRTSWGIVQQVEHSHGVPQRPGYGARLAVRKYGKAINKLARN
jgi:hypothetical protein